MTFTTSVHFIACHGAPADHFATFSKVLEDQGQNVQIHATGQALKKFQERGIEVTFPFSLENLSSEEEDNLADQIVKTASSASAIITDIGHAFDIKIHKALAEHAKEIPNFAYYDNPESFVPGGYSSIAAEVIQIAERILFANETLAKTTVYSAPIKEIDFENKKCMGIGYYPIKQAEIISLRRFTEHDSLRSKILAQYGLDDKVQHLLVYFGGNNEEYFSFAFPAFLNFLEQAMNHTDLSKIAILIQQHPGAKVKNENDEKNLDSKLVAAWVKKFADHERAPKVILSEISSDDAQVTADAAFYHQTSLGPQFVLANIPVVWIGHGQETYFDMLVRNGLATSVTSATRLSHIIENWDEKIKLNLDRNLILKNLGIREDWSKMLEIAIIDSILTFQ